MNMLRACPAHSVGKHETLNNEQAMNPKTCIHKMLCIKTNDVHRSKVKIPLLKKCSIITFVVFF